MTSNLPIEPEDVATIAGWVLVGVLAVLLLAGCSAPREVVVMEPVEVLVPVPSHAEPPPVDRPPLAIEGLTERSTAAEVARAYATSMLMLVVYSEALERLLDAYRVPTDGND